MHKAAAGVLILTLQLCGAYALADTARPSTSTEAIPPMQLSEALNTFARRTGLQVVYITSVTDGLRTNGAPSGLEPDRTLRELLKGTGLDFHFVNPRTVTIVSPGADAVQDTELEHNGDNTPDLRLTQVLDDANKPPSGQTATERAENTAQESSASRADSAVPEVLVTGSKILNMDIRRERDDAQPYVIFDRETVERSGALNVEDFLKSRLPMNTQAATNSHRSGITAGGASQVNLRGLGTNQTLVLVDGHRIAGVADYFGGIGQGDLNGIPLAAVERIEVLPTTASGIYGGSATGGVVNVVLRRDYTGIETRLTYENSFDSNTALRRVDVSGGFSLEDGRTDVLLAGAYSEQNGLQVGDRDFEQRRRARLMANDPSFIDLFGPPTGALTNIASNDGSPLFGPGTARFTHVPAGYQSSDGLAPLLANAGTYSLDLADTPQGNGGGLYPLLTTPTLTAFTATVRRQFTDKVQAFLEGSSARNKTASPIYSTSPPYFVPAGAPGNPFGQDLQVSMPVTSDFETRTESDNLRLVGGVIVKLTDHWAAQFDHSWNRVRHDGHDGPAYAGFRAAVEAGTVDVVRDTIAFPLDLSGFPLQSSQRAAGFETRLNDSTLRLSGPVFALPGGPVSMTAALERRKEQAAESLFDFGNLPAALPERSQTIDSAYLEFKLPLVSARNAKPGVRELELQLAARTDRYSIDTANQLFDPSAPVVRTTNEVSSTDPTVGLKYQPLASLMVRASYGTGFLPPDLSLMSPTQLIFDGSYVDPLRNNEPVGTKLFIIGGNPNLRPEQSESFSLGFVLTPSFVPGLRLSLDYTHIDKTDNVVSLDIQEIINNPLFAARITRGPDDPNDAFPVGEIISVDSTAVNIAQAKLRAYDVQLDYAWNTQRAGRFDFFAVGTRTLHYRTQTFPAQPIVENVRTNLIGDANIVLKFRGNAGVTWRYGNWTTEWQSRYFDSYAPNSFGGFLNSAAAQGNGGLVAAQIFHDLSVGVQLPERGSAAGFATLLSGLQIQAGIKNVFNTDPAIDVGQFGTGFSSFADPRLQVYSLTVKKSF